MSSNSNPERLPLTNSKYITKPPTIRAPARCASGFFYEESRGRTEIGAKGTANSISRLAVPFALHLHQKKEWDQNATLFSGAKKPVHHFDSVNKTGAKKRATPDLTGLLSKKGGRQLVLQADVQVWCARRDLNPHVRNAH